MIGGKVIIVIIGQWDGEEVWGEPRKNFVSGSIETIKKFYYKNDKSFRDYNYDKFKNIKTIDDFIKIHYGRYCNEMIDGDYYEMWAGSTNIRKDYI